MKLFVDTWGWLSLEDRRDAHHLASLSTYRERIGVKGRVFTSDYILDETFTQLFSRRPFAEAWRFLEAIHGSIARTTLVLEPVTRARFMAAVELRRKFADKPLISFTDLTSMTIMQELRISDVLTGDDHFQQVGLGFRLLPE